MRKDGQKLRFTVAYFASIILKYLFQVKCSVFYLLKGGVN